MWSTQSDSVSKTSIKKALYRVKRNYNIVHNKCISRSGGLVGRDIKPRDCEYVRR